MNYLVGIRDVDGRHVESGPVESRPLAEFLDDLHHHPLTVGLVAGLISLGQVEPHPIGVLLAQRLHDVQRAFTQSLKNKQNFFATE
jgi:hypothetical protein